MSNSINKMMFTNMRVGMTTYVPAHSKANGENVSARLTISAFPSERKRKDGVQRKAESRTFTAWGVAADILAWGLTPGKAFNAECEENVYRSPAYHNNQIVTVNGETVMVKRTGYVIREFDLGNDGWNHIRKEIDEGVRGNGFWIQGHQDQVNFSALLNSRMATAKAGYNPSLVVEGKWGFAKVEMPKYQHGAYKAKAAAGNAQVGTAPTAETVAATFTGAAPAAVAPVATPPAVAGVPSGV